jgi:hypothetical protein
VELASTQAPGSAMASIKQHYAPNKPHLAKTPLVLAGNYARLPNHSYLNSLNKSVRRAAASVSSDCSYRMAVVSSPPSFLISNRNSLPRFPASEIVLGNGVRKKMHITYLSWM